ncbi:polysaccharide deacetylase family protein [Streptomyces carpinensis]|uniref:Polysaccharide deacetylase n=1 Tax=Streptomyces carpinensis TaxID=66369 RepID=A0ABV1WIA9_9ACTN|nr:polysaccharide deacetylase [Streptomyces carpinensis]
MTQASTTPDTTTGSTTTKDIRIALGVDVDAVAGWLGSYGGEDSPNDIQRGVFAGEVGTPRLLKLFERYGIRTSWFIPGHSIETFPEQTRMVVEAGHEIGAHGYSHENPIAMTPRQEEDVLAKCVELIEQYTGRKPRGYVAPWWEMSPFTAELLHKYGFSYDHSQNYRDFTPFYARVGDEWTKIDYTGEAKDWMKPLVHGHEVDLVEFCGNWYVDDLPPMLFNKHAHNSHGYVSPRALEQDWKDQFDWVHRELDYAVLPITLHPDVSGRPQVLLMLERFIDYVSGHEGVSFCTLEDAADDFRRRFPFDGSERPADMR